MKNWMLALFVALALSACASCVFEPTPTGRSACDSRPPPKPRLPYDAWHLSFMVPAHMEGWVETIDVVDTRGLKFPGAYTGLAVQGRTTQGWAAGGGFGRKVYDAELPQKLYVRWQSLVEPQTYRAELTIPENVRKQMRERHRVDCKVPGAGYRDSMLIGGAPGGAMRVWLIGPCLADLEVLRAQAEVEPLGPSRGQTKGAYAYTFEQLEPATQRYIKEHGIPYGSW